jgi:hypothetical protein
VEATRLNLLRGVADHGDRAVLHDLQGRFPATIGPALTTFDELAFHATPAERSRMYEPEATTRLTRGLAGRSVELARSEGFEPPTS